MTSSIETIDCTTLDEFWNCVSPISETFSSPRESYIYRGQGNSDWGLVPKVYRSDVIDKYKTGLWSLMQDHQGQLVFEWALLSSFMTYCDSRGLAIPNDSMEFRKYFTLDRISRIHGSNSRDWPQDQAIPLMALAQHHGVPTRLLDWTSNPYVACYFSAALAITDESLNSEGKVAVFGLNLQAIHLHENIKHIRVPGSTSPNLSAQGGSFVLVDNSGYSGESFTPNVSLESKLANTKTILPILKKVTLPKKLAGELFVRCNKFGFSAATIFPGYDGAAKAALEGMLASDF